MSKPDPRTDEALMAAFVAGDKAAFRALFDRYSGPLLGMLRRSMPRDDDARDLLQQTFLQLHRARNDFKQGSRLKPWLYTIALNLKREYFRRRGRRPETSLDFTRHREPSAPPEVEQRFEHAAEVRAAVAALPEGQRTVIELHWFDDLTFAEIADTLGLGLSAVKVRAHRGYKKLRDSLNTLEGNL